MKRAIVIVIDSMGCGAMKDCADYGDVMECNTLCNVAKANDGLNAPNFYSLGLGNVGEVQGIPKNLNAIAQYGIMKETSKGDIRKEREACISLICLYIRVNSISESRIIRQVRPIASTT